MSELVLDNTSQGVRETTVPSISLRTVRWLVAAGSFSLAFYLVAYFAHLPAFAALIVSDLGQVLIVGAAAAVTISVARRLGMSCPLGRQWSLVGLGLVSLTAARAIWAYYEIALRQPVPTPGVSDVFRLGWYALGGLGILAAAAAYRKMIQMRAEALASLVLATFLLVVLYVYLGLDVLQNPAIASLDKIVNVAYPIGDVLLFIGPTALMLLVALRLRFSRLAWPWIAVGVGALLFAGADVGFLLMRANGVYVSGNPIDMGWMLGPVLVAAGASIALDVHLS